MLRVRGAERLERPFVTALEVESDSASEARRGGAGTDDVERARLETVRMRGAGGCRLAADSGVLGLDGSAFASPSVHCRCNITDFVAHYDTRQSSTSGGARNSDLQSSVYP